MEELDALEALHAGFVAEHPEWTERVEVGYVSRAVLQTLGGAPAGRIAVISPGEPLNVKEAESDWTLNWHAVCTRGETLLGPPPLELGPPVTPEAYRRAIEELLPYWTTAVRRPSVAYVPAHRGYIVVTLCRALLRVGDRRAGDEGGGSRLGGRAVSRVGVVHRGGARGVPGRCHGGARDDDPLRGLRRRRGRAVTKKGANAPFHQPF